MSENNISNKNISSPENTDPHYWRSFRELHQDPEFLAAKEHEFKDGVTNDFSPIELPNVSRRIFLALLGASAALAGTACTDYRDKGEIVPYNQKPEEITVGKPNFYASTCTACPEACGILIKTREGRPIKIDGNPDHPVNQGKICSKGQANILNLYDPERLKEPLRKKNQSLTAINWKTADDEIMAALMFAGTQEIALVTHTITSPTVKKLLDDFVKTYPSTKIYSYELFNNSIRNLAWQKSYGSGTFPLIKWNEAKVIVSLDGDFLGNDGNQVENSRLFVEGRDVEKKNFNRLYSIESNLSLTGINADYRLRLNPEKQFEFVMSLMTELSKKGISGIPDSAYSLEKLISQNKLNKETINYLVEDLLSNKGQSIIYAGNHLPENVHIAVNILNDVLGNRKLYSENSNSISQIAHSNISDFEKFVAKLNNNEVTAVIHLDSNPVYHLPEDLKYKSALSKAGLVVSLSERENESTNSSSYVLPINHNFESWGDAQTRTGVLSLQQPVIAPLHNSRQKEAVLLTWINGKSDYYNEKIYHNYLRENWEKNIYPKTSTKIEFKKFWLGALHDGLALTQETVQSIPSINISALKNESVKKNISGMTIILRENYFIGDGRFAHNGWLQELPHPISRITWDNYAAISEKTAKSLKLKDGDVIEIKVENRKLEIPIFMQAGNADDTITIELGYGRIFSGSVASGVGFNANLLMTKNSANPWVLSNAKITKTSKTYKLASTQEHHSFDDPTTQDIHKKRHIIQEGTVAKYLSNPGFIQEGKHGELESVYNQFEYNDVKWGMSIDLNKCTACAQCVVACNVENNVPVIGKDQVLKSREMQWLRIDRYYSGSAEEPKTSVQPMLCQHCDQAPCENVCPVVATTHSPDGLNQMVYNRCVGTRYCSNNCPYKVRRFNFFNFRDHFRNGYQENSIFALLHNPEVTVRSRGVMEKCTFCVQRISDARSDAIAENRKIKGSDVTVACQDACPTDAIKFGDINDEQGEFYNYRNHELGYYVLEELNVKPNVTYIAKLRNIHSEDA